MRTHVHAKSAGDRRLFPLTLEEETEVVKLSRRLTRIELPLGRTAINCNERSQGSRGRESRKNTRSKMPGHRSIRVNGSDRV